MNKITLIKLGYILAWLGTFSWLYAFTLYFVFSNFIVPALSGTILSIISLTTIYFISPWKLPHTKFIFILVPKLIVLISSVVWLIVTLQPITKENLSIFWFIWIFPLSLFIKNIGNKTWNDFNFN